jgi:serine protease inhibitor
MEIISSSPNPVILEAQDNFAVNLLREVSSAQGVPGSTILSPLSVALVLSMVYAGAKEKTHQEMGQLLGNGWTIYFPFHSFSFSAIVPTITL